MARSGQPTPFQSDERSGIPQDPEPRVTHSLAANSVHPLPDVYPRILYPIFLWLLGNSHVGATGDAPVRPLGGDLKGQRSELAAMPQIQDLSPHVLPNPPQ